MITSLVPGILTALPAPRASSPPSCQLSAFTPLNALNALNGNFSVHPFTRLFQVTVHVDAAMLSPKTFCFRGHFQFSSTENTENKVIQTHPIFLSKANHCQFRRLPLP